MRSKSTLVLIALFLAVLMVADSALAQRGPGRRRPEGGGRAGGAERSADAKKPAEKKDSIKSYDEVITDYGLIAEATQFPEDYSWVKFRLRENARWHDETPITPEDVIFSFDVFKEHNPNQSFYYRNVVKAEKTGEREVTFTFDQSGNRELPHIVGQLPILPKHYWEGTGANGQPRDITAGTLEPPLGSGPYRIRNFVAGRSISYERVEDYWAANLPVKLGKNNFDEIRFEYYRDTNLAF